MKTQKEMLELFVESNLFNSMDYDIQDEYPTFNADKDDARTYIFNRCVDGANIFDFIPLAIDQCLSKEDGIALIDEILTSLSEIPPDAVEDDVHKMKNALCSLSIGVEYDYIPEEFKDKFNIPYGDTNQIEMESFTYPIKSIDHLVEQIMDMKRVPVEDQKILVTGEAINDLKLAIEDAIDQMHHIESGREEPRLPVNHLSYTTRKSSKLYNPKINN